MRPFLQADCPTEFMELVNDHSQGWAKVFCQNRFFFFSTENYTNEFCHTELLLRQKISAILIWKQIPENPEGLDENWVGSRESSLGFSAPLSCMVRVFL